MKKLLHITFFLGCFVKVSAQNEKGLTAKFTFNKGEPVNEVNGKKASAMNVYYVEDRFGNRNFSCYMHGSPGSYLNLGTGPELKPIKGTVAVWVKIDIAMFGGRGYQFNPIILTKNNCVEDFVEAYSLSYDFKVKKIIAATTLSENRQIQLYAKDTLQLQKWHHLAMTYDDDSLHFYVDGILNAGIAKSFRSEFLKTDSVMVGNSASYKNERFLCGSVDDIMIYNRVLSPGEIAGLYNAPDPNKLHFYLGLLYKALGVLLFAGIITWFSVMGYKKQLEKREEANRINARLNELETRAIRAQMNPHFMFNSLNTLQRFILEEDFKKSHSYLIKFSKLLRKLLESSVSDTISLKEEIEILSTYVEIEKLRFDSAFDFTITSDIINPDDVYIPFMLVQPFVENAIWHGLLPKSNGRELSISFTDVDQNLIKCQVDDNGVGRKNSSKSKDPLKKKSLAMDFIKQRLEVIGKATGIFGTFTIVDKEDKQGNVLGTRIEILIPKQKLKLQKC